ncbi:MAG: hypothetical protein ABEH80_00860 [Halobaculum sp.]|jgi:hypothetical protein
MDREKLRAVGYGTLAVQGLLGLVAPRRLIAASVAGYRLCFENVEELEARPWLVRSTRITGLGSLIAGLVGVAVELRTDAEDADEIVADVLPGGSDEE